MKIGIRLDDDPLDGAMNMAIDQLLLERVQAGGLPVLRFYSWQPATLSLGYFQAAADRQLHSASRAVPMVRRASGGGAILHHRELTYSLCLPIADRADDAVRHIYDQVHLAIRSTFEHLGVRLQRFADSAMNGASLSYSRRRCEEPFLCFQRRTAEDLVLSGYKVVGSAQRRAAKAVLQHGSLLMDASPFAPELPGIRDLESKKFHLEEVRDLFTHRLGEALGFRWQSDFVSSWSGERLAEILAERFSSESWNFRR